VIAVDTNILVYAHRGDVAWHDVAASALRGLAEGGASWAIPWPCVHEFLAIVTHPRIFRTPTPLSAALDQVEAWRESPTLVCLGEPDGYWDGFRALVSQARITGPRTHDARVAAICLAHQVRELWTADRDFSLFPTLTTKNPLVST
jgi:toxin-antitoxin system PIN domain toxin